MYSCPKLFGVLGMWKAASQPAVRKATVPANTQRRSPRRGRSPRLGRLSSVFAAGASLSKSLRLGLRSGIRRGQDPTIALIVFDPYVLGSAVIGLEMPFGRVTVPDRRPGCAGMIVEDESSPHNLHTVALDNNWDRDSVCREAEGVAVDELQTAVVTHQSCLASQPAEEIARCFLERNNAFGHRDHRDRSHGSHHGNRSRNFQDPEKRHDYIHAQ